MAFSSALARRLRLRSWGRPGHAGVCPVPQPGASWAVSFKSEEKSLALTWPQRVQTQQVSRTADFVGQLWAHY